MSVANERDGPHLRQRAAPLLRSKRCHLLLTPEATRAYSTPMEKRVTYAGCRRTKMALLNMMRMVLWSFFGVRRGAAHEHDLATVKLPLLPVMAVVLATCFGGLLFAFAKIAVSIAH
jgi:hypothetical protein